jgi:hypothetical protein
MEKEIRRCQRCILPETLDGLTLNEEGICNHCLKYEKDFADWDSKADRKRKEFEKMLDKAKSLKRPYDCVVPLSGGKDSTYVLYLCSKVYKMKCLTVSLDNGYLSNQAKKNIDNALLHSDADHIYYRINVNNGKKLYNHFLKKTGNFCNACMREINFAIKLAEKQFKPPLVIKGSGKRVQYTTGIADFWEVNSPSMFGKVVKDLDNRTAFSQFYKNKIGNDLNKAVGAVLDILKIPRTAMMRYVPQHVGLYDYIYLPYTEIVEILKSEMGWNDVEGTVEHLDCSLHGISDYIKRNKIENTTEKTFYNSGLIRQGIITREEALKIEEELMKKTAPPEELFPFLEEVGIDHDQLINLVRTTTQEKFQTGFEVKIRQLYYKLRKL